MTSRRQSAISRRRFVQGIGAAAAVYSLGATPAFALTGRSLRVGVLVPLSMREPQVTRLLRGIQAGFDVASPATRIRFDLLVRRYPVGFGSAEKAAGTLLRTDGAATAIVVADGSSADELRRVVDRCGKRIVVAEAGGNVASPALAGRRLASSSLGYWQSAFALGGWAAANAGKRAFVCASCLESGYDSLYAFSAGFEAAGGVVAGTAVSHVRPGDDELPAAIAAMAEAEPDVVFGAYSGSAAVKFLRSYAATPTRRTAKLFTSAFAVDEAVLPRVGRNALGARSCLAWAPSVGNQGTAALVKAYSRLARTAPDAVAALGFDSAIQVARSASGLDARTTPALAYARGEAGASAPLYLREVRAAGAGLRNIVVARLGTIGSVSAQADAVRPELRTGWLEPYVGA